MRALGLFVSDAMTINAYITTSALAHRFTTTMPRDFKEATSMTQITLTLPSSAAPTTKSSTSKRALDLETASSRKKTKAVD